ncbi:MAG: VanZ family protein [Bacteroidia bacterium]|nr:VanZ family protein [Bacteroidia bacterium]
MKFFIYKYVGVFSFLWALIIFVLCATPGQYIPSNNWLDLLSVDKLVHAFIFCILNMLLITLAIKREYKNWVFVVFFSLCVGYGISLELMQAYIFSNRSADWQDAVANTSGCIIAFFFVKRIRRLKIKVVGSL